MISASRVRPRAWLRYRVVTDRVSPVQGRPEGAPVLTGEVDRPDSAGPRGERQHPYGRRPRTRPRRRAAAVRVAGAGEPRPVSDHLVGQPALRGRERPAEL